MNRAVALHLAVAASVHQVTDGYQPPVVWQGEIYDRSRISLPAIPPMNPANYTAADLKRMGKS